MGDPPTGRSASPGVWRLVGLAAALVLAASSWGSGSRPQLHTRVLWPGLVPWADTGGSPLAATVSILAMGLLVWAWWRLRRAPVGERWWWRTAALWFAPLVVSVPLYSRDLYSYAAQGALWADGLSPYEHGVRDLGSDWRDSTAPTWLDSSAPYGPVWLLVARAAATVADGKLWIALLLLRLVAVAAVVVIAWAVSDVAGRVGASREKAAWLAVAVPLVGAHFVSGAHNDALMVAGVLAGFALALRGWLVRAVLVVALAMMVKVTAVVALPFMALVWAQRLATSSLDGSPAVEGAAPGRLRTRDVGGGLALTAVTVVLPVALVSRLTGLGFGWVSPADTAGRNEQWTSLPTAVGMAVGAVGHVLGQPGWRETGIDVARGVGLVVLAVVLVLVWLGVAKPDGGAGQDGAGQTGTGQGGGAEGASQARIVRAAGWAYLAVILLAPAFLGWYFLWALPLFAAALAHGSLDRALERWLPVAATVLCFTTLPDGYSLGLTTTAIGVPIALVAAVLLVRAGWRWRRGVNWRGLLDFSRPLVGDRGEAEEPVRLMPSAAMTTIQLRRRGIALLWAVPIAALAGFALWAWTARIHAEDLAGFRALEVALFGVQRELPAFGQSERPPCGITDEGWIERTWTASEAPSPALLDTVLRDSGWRGAPGGEGRVYTRIDAGRTLTARVTESTGDITLRLTATSEANSLACLLH